MIGGYTLKFEQFHVGQHFRTKGYTVTLEEIIEFSRKYDPHYYHLDAQKAEQSYFGSIVASGMHTMSIINGEWVKLGILGDDMLGGMGIDAKWLKPVFPNDKIFADVEVINKKSLDDASGLLTLQFTGYNQKEEIWAKVKIRIIVKTTKSSIDYTVV
jgi:acyl dehydratase